MSVRAPRASEKNPSREIMRARPREIPQRAFIYGRISELRQRGELKERVARLSFLSLSRSRSCADVSSFLSRARAAEWNNQ